ncbi:chitinase [Streptomyces alfalfae]|uniref:Chitinase n=1 Tax=Streptomyces alfalfae TaxID=1642299 RepID=A0A1P8TBT4_9ACTN|nr:glycoside hydrolase family 19 protein [Streptomyces alfalfae]AYA15439.1 chitinase [Streptomyces fradiae]APY85098.1 chitinase [Streptomyces alfalfae]AYD61414.1 chitinase [Streptomyces alfalfae]QQC92599.1 chitinase [Streptomyces alfalfae]RXX43897.1 chitinase [Streptomyces alfalfae]
MIKRLTSLAAALAALCAMIVLGPAAATASAAACAAPWSSSSVYTGGKTASHNGHNWTAKWWTQNETPGRSDVWADAGACGGGTDPGNPDPSGFVVSEAQFNQMFPSRNSFYTYKGLTDALKAYPAFANTGSDTVKRQEAAAFLANVHHETGGLKYIVEQNQANYPHYCDANQPYGCPAGQAAYYGRGPIQLSWNFNYKAAGDALGIDLLRNPYLVERDPAVAWKTGLWYWNTQSGPGTMTPHNAMVNGKGFGETIRAINGTLECNGGNPAQVQSRIDRYKQFTQLLGTTPGSNLSC